MATIRSIIAVVGPSCAKKQFICNVLFVSRWLGAIVYWAVLDSEVEALTHLLREMHDHSELKIISTVHTKESFNQKIKKLLSEIQPQLVVLKINEKNCESEGRGWNIKWFHSLIEKISIPILAIPPFVQFQAYPIHSLFVPMSGERSSSPALELALGVANDVGVSINVIHISEEESLYTTEEKISHTLGRGEFYREFPQLVGQFITKACPYVTMRQRQVIRKVLFIQGDPIEQVLKEANKQTDSLMIMEWKGTLKGKHAQIVKQALRNRFLPVILIIQPSQPYFRLKVGAQFEKKIIHHPS